MRGGRALAVIASLVLVVPFAQAVPADTGPEDVQAARPSLSEDLRPAVREGGHATAFEAAHRILEHRGQAVGEVLPQLHGPTLEQQERNLDLAQRLLSITPGDGRPSVGRAIDQAELVSRWQAQTLGHSWDDADPGLDHETPSEAVYALLDRHEVTPTPDERRDIERLDQLPDRLANALTDVVDAFIGFEEASEEAYANLDQQAFPIPLEASRAAMPGGHLREPAADLGEVLPARHTLLEAAWDLQLALAAQPAGHQPAPDVNVTPVLAVDLDEGEANHYTEDVVLLVDAGGNDTYHNNAGGNGLGILARAPCQPTEPGAPAAALLDLRGDDDYGDPDFGRGCGVNGGGVGGSGFLFDAVGNDVYEAGVGGTNGGGLRAGNGFLFDGTGEDVYAGGGSGANGAGYGESSGLLVDVEGHDQYLASTWGVNGGGLRVGVGGLLDLAGNDVYQGGSRGANGGGDEGAVGFLFDLYGDDEYVAGGAGVNGGAHLAGVGFLADVFGSDAYGARSTGTNGGATTAGNGLLLDATGDDRYQAGTDGANGAGQQGSLGDMFGGTLASTLDELPPQPGLGSLVDGSGQDVYEDVDGGTGEDRTVLPKGTIGVQLDSDDLSP